MSSDFVPGTAVGTQDSREETKRIQIPVFTEFAFQWERQAVSKPDKRNT